MGNANFWERLQLKWCNLRIKQRMLVSYSLAVIIPIMLINAGTYIITRKFTIDTASQTIDVTLSKANSILNSYFTDLYERAVATSNIKELAQLLESSQEGVSGNGVPILKLSKTLSALEIIHGTSPRHYFKFYSDKEDISYFSGNLLIVNSQPYSEQEWYKQTKDFGYGVYWWDVHEENDFGGNLKFVTACRTIYDEESKALGISTISLDFARVEDAMSNLLSPMQGAVYIFDSQNNMVYSNVAEVASGENSLRKNVQDYSIPVSVKQHIFQNENGNGRLSKGMMFNYITIDQLMWKVVTVMPQEQFFGKMNGIWTFLLPVLLGTVLIFFWVTAKVSQSLSKPIEKLALSMQSQGEEASPAGYLNRKDEIGDLALAYVRMIQSNKDLMEETKAINHKKAEFQMQALQGQINSHFIYNTLNNIQWLAAAGRIDDVISTVTSLDKLLKACARRQGELVTIEDEIDYVDSYLNIQKIRFGNRFTYKYELESFAMQMRIPMFVLQPIVENSIYHGLLDSKNEHGIIRIRVSIQKETIVIDVYDNGKGLSEESVETVLSKERSGKDIFMGIALKNIDKRIKLSFGEEYGLSIESSYGEWTCVTVKIPMVEEVSNL